MKIGFEIHQQLDTSKLFCSSPSILREEDEEFRIMRRLRPSQSELGAIDEAAMKEFLKGKNFIYKGYNDSICLVELDEEPPRGPNSEAVDISLTIASMLKAEIVDEIHFMRKVVIDGSNTGGFQRTAIIAFDGYLETKEGRIRIPTICLEE
ncbi:MAG: Glu-tRNA(Gln) amidotransferase GatDE subunit E, partial [Nitrososphaeria archaeon]|nr:Glu-tRNA(Gln) amidotransferase GatDE subunit E [Nitrososphaeria archaeon]